MKKLDNLNELKKTMIKTSKIKEVKTMEQQVKKMVGDILRRAVREVPEYGDFAIVYEEFKNPDKTLEATDFMLKIVKPPKNIEGHEKIRNIELVAYKLPLPYKVTRIIGTGTKDDVLKQLEAPEFIANVEDAFKAMSRSLTDI